MTAKYQLISTVHRQLRSSNVATCELTQVWVVAHSLLLDQTFPLHLRDSELNELSWSSAAC